MRTFAIVASLLALVWLYLRTRGGAQHRMRGQVRATSPMRPLDEVDETPDAPQPFGCKCQWLAIRSEDSAEVVRHLGLACTQRSSWESGVRLAHGDWVFVTPAVQGWVFVVGATLPCAGEKDCPDRFTSFLLELGAHFPEVQYFGTHRVSEYQAWALVRDAAVVRAYAYAGDQGATLWNVGERTLAEVELGVTFFDERLPEAETDAYWDREDLTYPDEEYVMRLAGMWSINPQELAGIEFPLSTGVVGKLPALRTPDREL